MKAQRTHCSNLNKLPYYINYFILVLIQFAPWYVPVPIRTRLNWILMIRVRRTNFGPKRLQLAHLEYNSYVY